MTHDQTTPAPVEVTPADHEAYLALSMLPEKYAADVRAGRWDEVTGMQVLARHRIAHSAPAGEVGLRWEELDEIHYAYLGDIRFGGVWETTHNWRSARTSDAYGSKEEAMEVEEQSIRDWLVRAGLYTHPAPPADLVELVTILHQYRSDMIRPPAPDSRERRVAMIDAAIAKFGSA